MRASDRKILDDPLLESALLSNPFLPIYYPDGCSLSPSLLICLVDLVNMYNIGIVQN